MKINFYIHQPIVGEYIKFFTLFAAAEDSINDIVVELEFNSIDPSPHCFKPFNLQ